MEQIYRLFTIQAYEAKDPLGNLTDSTTINVIADTYEEAEQKARIIINKPFYRLSIVTEYFRGDKK